MAKPTAERREPITVRLAPKGRAWLSDIETKTEASLTDVVKACLAVARRHQSETIELIKEMTQ